MEYDFKNKDLAQAIIDIESIVEGLSGYGLNVGQEHMVKSIQHTLTVLNMQAHVAREQ